MKWLTLDTIKAHSRIDFNCDDKLLELYADAAEETVLNVCGTTYEELTKKYGDVPTPLQQASLMLVDLGYQQRCPASAQNLSAIPYTFDLLVKPYMIL
jgi:uncharacterized phage protein (predicted DNA packaging)